MSEEKINALEQFLGFRPAQSVPALGEPEAESARKLQALQEEMFARSVLDVQRGEREFLDEAFIEDQVGGRVLNREIPDFIFQNRLARREELPRAVEYVQQSGYLPEGAEAIGAKTRSGDFEVLYRTPDDPKTFYRVNEPGPSYGDVGFYAPDPTSLEFWGVVAAELAGPKGLGRLGKYALDALVAATGRTADEVIEDVSVGGEVDPERLRDAAVESGVTAIIGRSFGDVAEAGLNLRSGRGFRTEAAGARTGSPEIAEAVRFSEERGVRSPSLGELGVSPVMGRAESQALGFSADLQRRDLERRASYLQDLQQAATDQGRLRGEYANLDDAAIEAMLEQQTQTLRNQLERGIRRGGLDFEETRKELGGRALGDVINEYKAASSEEGRRLYQRLYQIAEEEGIEFDISNAQQVAREFLEPLALEAGPGSYPDLLRKSFLSPNSITPEELVILQRGPSSGEVNLERDYGPRLLNAMRALDEASSLQGTERLDALRKLTTYLGELSDQSRGLTNTNEERMASRLFAALRRDVQSSSDNAAFKEAADAADSFWRRRGDLLDSMRFAGKMNEPGGGELIYRSFMSNPTEDLAKEVVALLGKNPARKAEFQNAFLTDLLSRPDQISSRMDQYGRGVIEQFIPDPDTRTLLRRYQRDLSRIDRSALSTVLRNEVDAAERFRAFVAQGNTEGLRSVMRSNPDAADEIRTRIFQNMLDEATDFDRGQVVLNPRKYVAAVERLKAQNLFELLTPAQQRVIDGYENLSSFIKAASDAGSSISSADISAAQANVLLNPGRALAARGKGLSLWTIARLAQAPVPTRSFAGKEPPQGYPATRAMLLGLSQVARDLGLRAAGPEAEDKREEESPEE